MPLSESILSNTAWNKFSLRFESARLEAHYKTHTAPRLLAQSRLALILGALMYEMYGILDFLLVPKNIIDKIEFIRISTTFAIIFVFGLSFTKHYKKYNQALLVSILMFAGLGLIWKMALIDQHIFSYYFSGMILLLFWIHAFYILNFINAFFCTLSIIVLTTISFFTIFTFNYNETICYIFILFSAFGVSMFSSYISEKADRSLFLREKELDRERHIQRERATHDSLTGLPNRVLLLDRINQAIHDSHRNNQISAGIFLDLDNFKIINDTYGHLTGDHVLIEVSKRLTASIRAADTVARLSGDEFFVLARDIKSIEHAKTFANKLLKQIKNQYSFEGSELTTPLSASIGICVFPFEGVTAMSVIDRADRAMYQVKLSDKSGIQISEQ
ncbi:MAG TPA: GGDEF domain-containing protein [Methylotenera sp.]|nr:GGDEF domain-containing protein [Methylotenera sp.]